MCLGYVARLHGAIDQRVVVPLVKRLLSNPVLGGVAQDAPDDMGSFARRGDDSVAVIGLCGWTLEKGTSRSVCTIQAAQRFYVPAYVERCGCRGMGLVWEHGCGSRLGAAGSVERC